MINAVHIKAAPEDNPSPLRHEGRGAVGAVEAFQDILRSTLRESPQSTARHDDAAGLTPLQAEQSSMPRSESGRAGTIESGDRPNARDTADTPGNNDQAVRSRAEASVHEQSGRAGGETGNGGERPAAPDESARKERGLSAKKERDASGMTELQNPGIALWAEKPAVSLRVEPDRLPVKQADAPQREQGAGIAFRELKSRLQDLMTLLNTGEKSARGDEAAAHAAKGPESPLAAAGRPGTGRGENDPRKLLDQINRTLERITAERETAPGNRPAEALTQLQGLIQRLAGSTEKQRTDHGSAVSATEIRDLSVRIAALSGSIKSEQAGNRNADEGSRHGLTPGMQAHDTLFRRFAARQDAPSQSGRFQEQLQNMVEQARIQVRDSGNASMALRLHPRELGSMNVNLGLEQGVINGRFTVQTEEARMLLQQNLEFIRRELESAGIAVGDFQVNVSDHGEGFNGENRDGARPAAHIPGLTEIASGYESNAIISHNGEINVII